jgi:ribosome-binding factor A
MARNTFHDGPGPSQRQLRVAELLRRRLSEVLSRGDIHDPELNRLSITVGEVRVSPDLKVATAYVVPLGGKGSDDMFDLLKRNASELRRAVSRGLNLKYAPELRFRLDETFDQLDDTRRLFADPGVQRDIEG